MREKIVSILKTLAVTLIAVLAMIILGTSGVSAYPQYSQDGDATYCRACHGDFRASPYFSLNDGANWGDDAHDVHHSDMLSGDCDTCHSGGPFFPVILNASDGGDDSGCSGDRDLR